jgi:hypothetical protein
MMIRLFIDRISHSIVFLLHDASRFGPSVGTGFIVSFGGCIYIVSARHNFTFQGENTSDIVRTWHETKFKFRDRGTLQFHENRDIPEENFVLVSGKKFSTHTLVLISKKHDLIAVRLEPDEVVADQVCPFELRDGAYSGDIKVGASLITVGMPFAGRIKLRSGPTVFSPHFDHVRYDPDISPAGLPHLYRAEDHILYHYSNEQDGISPSGYSGAPVWANNGPDVEGVWSVQPAIVGIALEYYKRRQLIRAVRIGHLIDLLESDLVPGLE